MIKHGGPSLLSRWPKAASSGPTPAEQVAAMFASGEQGTMFDFTDETTVFQDSVGGSAVTKPGDPLWAVSDLSGNGNHATRNRGNPRWMGMPATWGANLVDSPLFEVEADWSGGTGWAWADEVWTKTAGTEAAISQAVTLTPGKTYMIVPRIATRTAGTVKVRLTGGTTVTHNTAMSAAGSYIELLTAVTGNNTLELLADASFAGTIKALAIFEVTSFYDMGVYADADERLITGNIDMSASNEMTIIASTMRAFGGNMILGQVAPTAAGNGERLDASSIVGFTGTDGSNSDSVTENDPDLTSGHNFRIYALRRDTNETAIANQRVLNMNGLEVAQTNTGGPLTSPTANSSTAKVSLLAYINNSSLFRGWIYRVLVINRRLTDEEMAVAVRWAGFDGKFMVAAVTGDSTWVQDGPPVGVGRGRTSYSDQLLAGIANVLPIANWGDDNEEQLADWNALTGTSLDQLDAVIFGAGLNDIAGKVDGGATLAQRQAFLQSLIDAAANDCPNARMIGWQLEPCLDFLEDRTNAANCIAAREGWNTGLLDGTITGLDAVCTQHVAELDDGAGYLAPLYNTGVNGVPDGVHPDELGRLIMNRSLRQTCVSKGWLQPARTFA